MSVMQIYINNQAVDLADGTTLGTVLCERGLTAAGTAVAVDGKIVAREAREAFVLTDGAKVLVIQAACGG